MFRPVKRLQFKTIESGSKKIELARVTLQLRREKLLQQESKKAMAHPEDPSVGEARRIIRKIRTRLLVSLSKYSHTAVEQNPHYSYSGDLSGRFSKLDKIAGNFHTGNISLRDLEDENSGIDGIIEYCQILQQLNDLLCPIKALPPLKKSLQDAIKFAIENLIQAIDIRKFFPAVELQDSISNLCKISKILNIGVLLKLINSHHKIINAMVDDKKIMSSLPTELRSALYLSISMPQESKSLLVIDKHIRLPTI